MKIDRVFNSKQEEEREEKFYKAIMTLSNLNEHKAFFNDICTPAELQSIKDRWSVAELLDKGYTYREINTLTGVSVTTIGRVARFLHDGSGGYSLALKRLK